MHSFQNFTSVSQHSRNQLYLKEQLLVGQQMRQWPIIFILRPPARTSNMWLFLSAAAIHYLCHKKNEFFSPHSTLVGFLFHGEIACNCFCYASDYFLKMLFVSHSFGKGCVTSNSETKDVFIRNDPYEIVDANTMFTETINTSFLYSKYGFCPIF